MTLAVEWTVKSQHKQTNIDISMLKHVQQQKISTMAGFQRLQRFYV